ncbi:Hypothetical predicted protein, partial [Pelobates cultripes]
MQLRPSYERKCSSEASNFKEKNSLTMHTNSGHPLHQTGNGESSSVCLTLPPIRHPAEGSSMTGDVAVEMHSTDSDSGPRSGSRQARANPHGRFQNKHSHVHTQSHETGGTEAPNNTDSRENSSSISEALHFYPWLEKSFPYILIFGAKLIVQHITGISVGIGLLTTFLYANKCIVNQVFLRTKKLDYAPAAWIQLELFADLKGHYSHQNNYSLLNLFCLVITSLATPQIAVIDPSWATTSDDYRAFSLLNNLQCAALIIFPLVMIIGGGGYPIMVVEELGLEANALNCNKIREYENSENGVSWCTWRLLSGQHNMIALIGVYNLAKYHSDTFNRIELPPG